MFDSIKFLILFSIKGLANSFKFKFSMTFTVNNKRTLLLSFTFNVHSNKFNELIKILEDGFCSLAFQLKFDLKHFYALK